MNEDMKKLLATIGRALITLAGDEAAAAQTTPAAPEQPNPRKGYKKKERQSTCMDCGITFITRSALTKRCPICAREHQLSKVRALAAKEKAERQAAKAETAAKPSQSSPAPTPKQDTVRCERMHATIPASMCGTRGECQGKPTCPNLPKEKTA